MAKIKQSPPQINMRDSQYYFNRELNWLEFNYRVLHEAFDPRTPLLERLKFSAIFSSNLDEFFMIQVSTLKEQVEAQVSLYAWELQPNGQYGQRHPGEEEPERSAQRIFWERARAEREKSRFN